MVPWKSLKRSFKQMNALIQRNIQLEARFKLSLFSRYLAPFIQVLMPLIIFEVIFTIREDYQFGYWTGQNFVLFLLIAFCIQFLRRTIYNFQASFGAEKYWKTLQALMVAPINRYVLLFGFLIADVILILIPFVFFFILGLIFFPISILNILMVILAFFSLTILFGSIGLINAILIISREGSQKLFSIGLILLFWLSCISYPLQIFPEIVQYVILLNPFFYFIDFVRIIWLMGIDFNLALSSLTITHIVVVGLGTIILPIIAVYIFNTFYDKFGISGY